MIKENQYREVVKSFFNYLITEFNLKVIDEKSYGNAFYDIQYGNDNKRISISYENIEDYFQVIIFKLENGKLPDYDDKTRTLHLNHLNRIVSSEISNEERKKNSEYFLKLKPEDELEKKILKGAKDLRLCLNYYKQKEFI